MPQSRFMGPGEQPSTETINEMLAAVAPVPGPGMYVDSMPGRGIEIHLDEPTYDQVHGRHSFLARITRKGPGGEEDLEGSNYWVHEVRPMDRADRPLRFIEEGDENVLSRMWIQAVNLAEFKQGTPDDETHLLGLEDEQLDDDGAIVRVELLLAPGTEPGKPGYSPQWVFFGAIGAEGEPPAIQLHFKSHEADHLVCRAWNGETEGDTDILIAKPYLLRRTPFDGESRNDIEYTYEEPDIHWERLAENVETKINQREIIILPYVLDDILYAIDDITGGTSVEIPGEPDPIRITRLDSNSDGRAFGRKYTEEK